MGRGSGRPITLGLKGALRVWDVLLERPKISVRELARVARVNRNMAHQMKKRFCAVRCSSCKRSA